MSIRRGEWPLVTEDLSKFPQGTIIHQLISVQAIHDVIACHDVFNLTLIMSDKKGIIFLSAFEPVNPSPNYRGTFLGAIIMMVNE